MRLFFKYKPRGFNYIPRYYDPQKDAWNRKKAGAGLSTNFSHEESLRLQMRNANKKERSFLDPREHGGKLLRVLIIIAVVILAFYLIMSTSAFEKVLEGLMNK